MKKPCTLFFVLCFCKLGMAQVHEQRAVKDSIAKTREKVRSLEQQLTDKRAELKALQGKLPPKRWTVVGKHNILFDQTSFSNWASGGDNSVALSARMGYRLDYRKGKHTWGNDLILAYGLRKTGDEGTRKTDDELRFSLKYNCRYTHKWSVGGALDFQTQFAKGYNHDVSDTDYVSKFMAPGYLTTGPTIDYKPSDNFYVSMSPAAIKFNFVLDEKLSDRGDYGVDPGQSVFTQFGGNISAYYRLDLLKNVSMENRLSLYADYLKNLGNVDVNYDAVVDMRINQYLYAQFTLGLRYDDDAKVEIGAHSGEPIYGKRLQVKQTLGIGLAYTFTR